MQTCYWRHKAAYLGKQCDAPVDTCMPLNAGADFAIRHELGPGGEIGGAGDPLAASLRFP
jgi:hypothetical protein